MLDGKSLLSVAPNKRNIGMVFQRYTLFPHLTVGENVAFPLRVRRLPDAEVKAKVEQMLKLVHLGDCRDRMPASCPAGCSTCGDRACARSRSAGPADGRTAFRAR